MPLRSRTDPQRSSTTTQAPGPNRGGRGTHVFRSLRERLCGTQQPPLVAPHDPPRYRYAPLPTPTHIRTLLLHAAEDASDPLVGGLHELDLSGRDAFSALSYSWATEDGDASFCRPLTIDGQRVGITANLDDGLRRIRRRDGSRRVWIDALCIDQADEGERNRQVAMMADIYRRAERVLVWLGEGDDAEADRRGEATLRMIMACGDLHMTERALNDYPPCPEQFDLYVRAALHADEGAWCPGETARDHGTCTKLPAASLTVEGRLYPIVVKYDNMLPWREDLERVARALSTLFAKRYWTRRWVAQELILARAQDWYWGACVLSDVRLTSFNLLTLQSTISYFFLHHVGRPPLLIERSARLLQLKEDCVFSRSDGSRIDLELLEALEHTSHMNCSDPRDRLFALLGLFTHPPMDPDYSLSTSEVYIAFAGSLMQNNMAYVVYQQFRSRGKPIEDDLSRSLPSWVPDLRVKFTARDPVSHSFNHFMTGGTVDDNGRTLRCELYLLGVFTGIDLKAKYAGMKLDLPGGLPGDRRPLYIMLTFGRHCEPQPGDLICATNRVLETHWKYDETGSPYTTKAMVLALRPGDTVPDRYRLIGAHYFAAVPHETVLFTRSEMPMHVEAEEGSQILVDMI